MKKVAILSVGDYRHITLISKYTSFFNEINIDYDVICTDRYNEKSNRIHVLQYSFSNINNSLDKAKAFLGFHHWASKIIVKNDYDFIVVWNENTALLFADLLIKKYRNRYCVNIRDVDFLSQKFLNIFRKKVILGSKFSTYCSTAKLDFPSGYNYLLMRSMNLEILKNVTKRQDLRTVLDPIRIVFIGKVRFKEANDEIIRAFGNDNRYEVYFIGAGSENLNNYLTDYNNVFLVGAYAPEETANYLENADVINSYFGTKVLGYERMSSIRFSYAPYIHIPVIVGTKTNMAEEGEKYGFAYSFGECPIEDEADSFFSWYHNLDTMGFINGCENYCKDVKQTDQVFYDTLKNVFKE